MIVGITGPIASGKSVLAQMLVEKGFIRLTLSEEVREELRKKGEEIERAALQDLGNEMRAKHGNGFWAKRLIAKMSSGKNYVVEGIRNPGEVEEFRKLRNFVLIGVNAPIERRIEWIKARNKDSDPKNISGIKTIDARDRGVGEKEHGQQTSACFDLADDYIVNNTDLEDLRAKALELVQQLIG
ncbi:MAG: dephospho-CoA kinase [Nanoarchaeota archaeon]|nr:dephospho-CoA kinase [Nanoarchaeota archaeon]